MRTQEILQYHKFNYSDKLSFTEWYRLGLRSLSSNSRLLIFTTLESPIHMESDQKEESQELVLLEKKKVWRVQIQRKTRPWSS